MSDNLFDGVIKNLARATRQSGIKRPALFYLNPDARPAQAVHEAVSGRSLERRTDPAGDVLMAEVTCTVDEATAALRGHAGLGGRLVANLLEAPPLRVDAWWMLLDTGSIWATAFRRGKAAGHSSTPLDRLPPVELCSCCAHREGPVPVVVPVDGGIDLFIQCADIAQAVRAMTLARVVANRRLPVPEGVRNPLELPVGDGELVTILADFYADAPEVVAEVTRALGWEWHPGRRWLQQTLRSTPALSRLADQVDGLTGESDS